MAKILQVLYKFIRIKFNVWETGIKTQKTSKNDRVIV